ncbi:MAG: UDP-N-acetylmuramate dehydrogenase [Aestuariivita sp.]|nr:UDP-N-acetylmuramate dehydrogenase [Aestuariivita sp.]MCY4202408.1 UDP-N-acetylmuramate dehydrogenase [Aestuariivita sp.]
MLPSAQGKLRRNVLLSDMTWLRVGGIADAIFRPTGIGDLVDFISALDPKIRVFVLGVGSNLIVRDGGFRGVVIRLGRAFNSISVDTTTATVTAGGAVLAARIAQQAASLGIDLTFLRTIPGTIGGAVRMNAGCYQRYLADVFCNARLVTREGAILSLVESDLNFGYRTADIPPESVIVEVTLRSHSDSINKLQERMQKQVQHRRATQPVSRRSAGSAFRNPAGHTSSERRDENHDRKAWKLIDAAGMRGARRGDAQISEQHSNFLINTGNASAADLEKLGEEVRKKVYDSSGIMLEWELIRVGDPIFPC